MLFASIEICIFILFILCLADAIRSSVQNKRKLALLLLAFVYALIFENFNMYLSRGFSGSYFYNDNFFLYFLETPVFIALAWAVLIYTAMHISDVLKLKALTRPFLDALLVILIDLTLDVVAIRQGIWTWVDFSPSDGWFGVPSDNLVGWLFVTFMFSFLFRYFTRSDDDMVNKGTRTEYYFLLPPFAYLAMLIMFSLVNLAESILNLTKAEELFVLWALVILFGAMIREAEHKPAQLFEVDGYTIFVVLLTRLLFFSYIIWSFVLMGIYKNLVLDIILILSIAAEIIIYHAAFGKIGVHDKKLEMAHY